MQHTQKLESLGVLAGGIAHDFNNLLMGILGNADLALDALSPLSPGRDNIMEIEKASKRAADLANQMLAYSGKGRFVIETIDLNRLVGEIAHLIEVAIPKKVSLQYRFADDLPVFSGDATQIRQVIMNLITNASESVGKKSGGISLVTGSAYFSQNDLNRMNELLQVSDEQPLPEGRYVYIEVSDTGCGMDPAALNRIFDPFYTTKFTGRGLGLSAVLGIVRGHKGALDIKTEKGKGSTFRVLFPGMEMVSAKTKADESTGTGAQGWQGEGTVLIVDDEPLVCEVGEQMLKRMGFDVFTASDGEKALEVYRDHNITCVLLDLTMPAMDGKETFLELQKINPDVKVILCSGYNEQDVVTHFSSKGLAGFLQKPFKKAALMKKLAEVLEK